MLLFEKITALFTDEPLCPKFGVKCRKHRCHAYGQRIGYDGNTGEKLTEEGCTIIEFRNKLAVENTIELQGMHAGFNSMRNEMMATHQEGMRNLVIAVEKGLKQLGKIANEQITRDANDALRLGDAVHADERSAGGSRQPCHTGDASS